MHEVLHVIEPRSSPPDYGRNRIENHWKVATDYRRRETISWMDPAFGQLSMPPECQEVLGYDLSDKVRDFLESGGWTGLSILEVVLTVPKYQHLRQFVGPADVLYSHVQSRQLLSGGRIGLMEMMWWVFEDHRCLPPRTNAYVWLDAFSLKQCAHDFTISAVLQLVEDIPFFVAETYVANSYQTGVCKPSSPIEYATRSFCILELYAAARCRKTICFATNGTSDMNQHLEHFPVDVASATARHNEEKEIVDKYIVENVGYEQMNTMITQALLSWKPPR